MGKADGGELVARIMRENRARYCFAINGGHLFPILAQLRAHEIKLITPKTIKGRSRKPTVPTWSAVSRSIRSA